MNFFNSIKKRYRSERPLGEFSAYTVEETTHRVISSRFSAVLGAGYFNRNSWAFSCASGCILTKYLVGVQCKVRRNANQVREIRNFLRGASESLVISLGTTINVKGCDFMHDILENGLKKN